jgi:hypothetical protein
LSPHLEFVVAGAEGSVKTRVRGDDQHLELRAAIEHAEADHPGLSVKGRVEEHLRLKRLDLLKLVHMDSSLPARKKLAAELNFSGGPE